LTIGQAYGIATTALRFFNVYGPRQSLSNPYTGACAIFSARLRNGKPPVLYEDGRQTRDFVHVSDIAQAILLTLDNPKLSGQILNVGTGRPASIREVAEALAQAYGVKIPPTIAGRFRAGDIRHCFADVRRLSSFGFRPRITLGEGLKDLVLWGTTSEADDLLEEAERELLERRLLGD
jgi:dTDP-L-rhamnose 4-epimerase